jgi:hypothetical protein
MPKMREKAGLTRQEAGARLGLSARTMTYHVRKGHVTCFPDGSIDPDSFAKFHETRAENKAEFEQGRKAAAKAEAVVKETVQDYYHSRALVEQIKAEREQLLLDELRGLKVDRQEVEDVLFTASRALRDTLKELASRLAPRMVRVTKEREAYDLLTAEHREALERFADELGQYGTTEQKGA